MKSRFCPLMNVLKKTCRLLKTAFLAKTLSPHTPWRVCLSSLLRGSQREHLLLSLREGAERLRLNQEMESPVRAGVRNKWMKRLVFSCKYCGDIRFASYSVPIAYADWLHETYCPFPGVESGSD